MSTVTVGRTQDVFLYSSPNNNIAHIAVQLQHNDRFSNCLLFINNINCTAVDGWKDCTKVLTVATQFVQKCCYIGTLWCVVQR